MIRRDESTGGIPDPLPGRALAQRERLQELWQTERAARLRSDEQLRRLRAANELRSRWWVRLGSPPNRVLGRIVRGLRRIRASAAQDGIVQDTSTSAAPDATETPSADHPVAPVADVPRVAIHIGAVSWEAAAGWGDLPFAEAIGRAFERRGWRSTVYVHAERDSDEAARADLAMHLFGARAPALRERQPSVLWIISHPDYVTRQLCQSYELIGVASSTFLEDLRAWLGADGPELFALPQATDPERFHPEYGGPPHELLFIGNSRRVRRPIIDHLAGTAHDLAVYGRDWTPALLDPRHLRGGWIPNDELHRYYAAAAIVLNDAYADMQAEGFVPNRIYDALASGAFVISEPITGLDTEFEGAVVTYRDREHLLLLIEHYLANPDERRRLAEAGRAIVLARHTFDQRVATILERVGPHLHVSAPPTLVT